VLEDAGIKIDSVASRLLGVSGREMIEALIAGERDPGRLADLARGVLRRKADDLQMACDGRFTGGHGQMCRLRLDAYDHLSAKIAELDALIAEAAAPFAAVIARLMTIPGIGQRTAEVIVAGTGGDMTRFAASARLAAWAGLAPGDNESADKRKYASARPGNRYLRAVMTEAAWATARTRTRPGARFRRLARRFGKGHEKKAATAVARTLICIAWAVMARGQDYADAGEDYYDQRDQRNREHLIRHHQQALARLGYQVTLSPPGDGTPPHRRPQPAARSLNPPPPVTGVPPTSRLRRRCRAPSWDPQVSLQRHSICADVCQQAGCLAWRQIWLIWAVCGIASVRCHDRPRRWRSDAMACCRAARPARQVDRSGQRPGQQ
jgi:transposase